MFHILPIMCGGGAESPGAEPTILSVGNVQNVSMACPAGTPWGLRISWTLDFPNDTGYEIQIRDALSLVLVVSGLPTSDPYYDHSRVADTGDPGSTGFFHNAQYDVELVKKSDSSVVQSMTTALVTVETGPSC